MYISEGSDSTTLHQLFDGKDVQQMWDIMSEILLENERMYIPNKVLEINGDTKHKETFSMVIIPKKSRRNITYGSDTWRKVY